MKKLTLAEANDINDAVNTALAQSETRVQISSRDKVLAVLATANHGGIYAPDVAKKAGISFATLRKVVANDDGTIYMNRTTYCTGRDTYTTLSVNHKLTLTATHKAAIAAK